LGAQVNFGVEGARGNLLFEVVKDSKRYTTNPVQTAALEKDDLFTAAALSFRIWPKSSLFFRAEQTGINYGTRNADNMLSRYFAGIKWDASGKTSGSIKIGSATKNFSDDSVHQDHSGSNWSATVRWVPVERSRITLTTDRGFYDTTGGSDDVIDRKHQSIKWDYAWSSRVKSDINYKYGSDGYSGLSGTNRSDRISSYSMNVNYQMGRYWTVGMGYSNDRRDSNINSYDYTKKISMIHVNASL
ncbi:MAG: outer membrane beta-barrel protein, partial [Chromatiales bacterium]|nr:outer membrane beta-barrel protein [Chromatiales bacterium]